MKHSKTKAAVLSAAVIAATTLSAVPAFAGTTYTPVAGTSCTFDKYLIMEAGASVPNATFSYTIAPGSAISVDTSDNTVMQVNAGVGTPTASSTTFSPSDTTYTSVQEGDLDVARTDRENVKFETAKSEKYAVQTSTIDFSHVQFTEPGIYRYIVTETAATAAETAAGIVHDDDVDRVLDVYVTDDGTGALQVSGYVMHKNVGDVVINTSMGSADVATQAAALADKDDGFSNEVSKTDLAIKKEVTGNQASRDKYFAITVEITGETAGNVLQVSLADDNDENTAIDGNADSTSGTNDATIAANAGQTNPTSLTVGPNGTVTQTFYLQHGQNIVIRGISPSAGYTVTENAEDYKSNPHAVTGWTDDLSKAAIGETDIKTSFQNERNGIIPTGVVVAVGAGIALAGGGVTGIVLTKKRRDDDED